MTPVYPGDPEVRFRAHKIMRAHGSNVLEFTCGTHTGTHVDAPRHMIAGGVSVTDLGAGGYFGTARCFRLNDIGSSEGLRKVFGKVRRGEAVFIDTGHGAFWKSRDYYSGWPCISAEAARFLIRRGISAFGIDTPSVDPRRDKGKIIHTAFLKNGIPIYENLAHVDSLPDNGPFAYFAFPLPLEGADGSPVAVFALIGDGTVTGSIASFKRSIVSHEKGRSI
jgi:kynurenine formamidase